MSVSIAKILHHAVEIQGGVEKHGEETAITVETAIEHNHMLEGLISGIRTSYVCPR